MQLGDPWVVVLDEFKLSVPGHDYGYFVDFEAYSDTLLVCG